MKKALVSTIFKNIGNDLGVEIIYEPEFEFTGAIVLGNNKRYYFRNNFLDINTLGAAEIAQDKDYAAFYIKKMDYPTPVGFKFYSDKWCKEIESDKNIASACAYAKKIRYPLILKPNDSTQGNHVYKIYNKTELVAAAKNIFYKHRVALLQKIFIGRDYRIVVFDNIVYAAYERIPLSIIGDGKNSIKILFENKLRELIKSGREINLELNDNRIAIKLKHDKIKIDDVPNVGQTISLLNNANLSCGGDVVDVTDIVSKDFKKIACDISQKMNLRLCGLDIITKDDITSDNPKKYVILEISPAPGLDHFAAIGKHQNKIVTRLYTDILKAMIKER